MKYILQKPIITEKSMAKIAGGSYVFKVSLKANKAEVKSAINDLYKVKVIKVNMIRIHDEKKIARGRYPYIRRGYKKAIITLKKGQKIPGFEEKE